MLIKIMIYPDTSQEFPFSTINVKGVQNLAVLPRDSLPAFIIGFSGTPDTTLVATRFVYANPSFN